MRPERELPPFAEALRERLLLPLPGRPAQELMLPGIRRGRAILPPEGEDWRAAAVLILIHPGAEGGLSFPLVERSSSLGRHRGEIGLPGGSLENGEASLDAALRETSEELGLGSETMSTIKVLGALTALKVPPSGFEIFPWIAYTQESPSWTPAYPEIEGVLEFPIENLSAPLPRLVRQGTISGQASEIPYFELGGREVWGATAMILAELAAVLA